MTDRDTLAPYAILALRLTTGSLFLVHGLIKLLVFTPAGTAGYFQSIGLPGALGYLTLILEILGGIALILESGCVSCPWRWCPSCWVRHGSAMAVSASAGRTPTAAGNIR